MEKLILYVMIQEDGDIETRNKISEEDFKACEAGIITILKVESGISKDDPFYLKIQWLSGCDTWRNL